MSVSISKKQPARWTSIFLGGIALSVVISASPLFADSDINLPEPREDERQGNNEDSSPAEYYVPIRREKDDEQSGNKPDDDERPGKQGDDDDNEHPVVSINSTSQNNPDGPPDEPVEEQPFIDLDEFTVIAVNDLGMHCGDMDTRILNILPPFNVLHAVVIQKGPERSCSPGRHTG